MHEVVDIPLGPVAPPPPADDPGAPFWEATRERRLVIQTCEDCGHRQHYPRPLCLACGGTSLRFDEAAGTAKVVSHTTVARAPFEGLEPPYVIAIVELDEGVRLLTRIVDEDRGGRAVGVECDEPVAVAWVPLFDGRHLPVFRPA